jgi:hypothetical protein
MLLAAIGALCPSGWMVCLSRHGVQLVAAVQHPGIHHHGTAGGCCGEHGVGDGDEGGCTDLDPAPLASQPTLIDHPAMPTGVLLGVLPLLSESGDPLRALRGSTCVPGPPPVCLHSVALLI